MMLSGKTNLFCKRSSKTSRDALMRKLSPGSLSIKSRVNELSGANTNFSKFRLSSFKPVDKQVNNFGEAVFLFSITKPI